MTAADRPPVTDNARAEEQSEYTVQQTAAHFARRVQRVSDRIRSTDYQRSVSDLVALDVVEGFLDRIARDDLDVFAAARAETTTATVEDAIEVAYRMAYDVMRHHPGIWHNSLRAAVEALADEGLLATARTRPTREQIARALFLEQHPNAAGAWDAPGDHGKGAWHLRADAVLALLADQPTEAEAKAQGWDEGHRTGWEHCQDGNYGNDYWDDPTPNPYRSGGER